MEVRLTTETYRSPLILSDVPRLNTPRTYHFFAGGPLSTRFCLLSTSSVTSFRYEVFAGIMDHQRRNDRNDRNNPMRIVQTGRKFSPARQYIGPA